MITALRAGQGRTDFPRIVVHFWCLIIVLHKHLKKVQITQCLNGALKMLLCRQKAGLSANNRCMLFWSLSSQWSFRTFEQGPATKEEALSLILI